MNSSDEKPRLLRGQMSFKDETLGNATVVHSTRTLLGDDMVRQMQRYITEHGDELPHTPQKTGSSKRASAATTPSGTSRSFEAENEELKAIRRQNTKSQQKGRRARDTAAFEFMASAKSTVDVKKSLNTATTAAEFRSVGALPKIEARGPIRQKPNDDALGEMFAAGKHFPPPTTAEQFKVRYTEIVRRYDDPKLPVCQWVGKLLAELKEVAPPDAPKPQPLRSACAMFILDKVFEAFQLPREVFDDICATVCLDGGQETVDAVQGTDRRRAAPPEDRYNYIERRYFFQALERSKAKMAEVAARTRAMLEDAQRVKERLKTADDQAQRITTRMLFGAWRSVLRQQAWRTAAGKYHSQRDNLKLKALAFNGWRAAVVEVHHVERVKALGDQVAKVQDDANDRVAAFKSDSEMQVREMKQELSVTLGGKQRMVDLEEQEQLEQELASLTVECASLQRRIGELEGMIKVTRAERDRQQEVATSSADSVHRALEMTVGGRQRGGVKAADLLMNAESFSHGDVGSFRFTDKGGSDVVAAPVLVKAHHILLAFANCIVERCTDELPHITQVAVGMGDGAHYATLLTHIFPNSRVGPRMAAVTDIAERFTLLVNEGSPLLKQRDMQVQGASTSRRKSSVFGDRRPDPGPLVASGVSALDLAEGSEPAHLVCLYFLLKSYFAHFTVGDVEDPAAASTKEESTERESVALYLCQRSLASWRVLLQHVEDDIVASFYLLAKGSRAEALLSDVREDAIMSRFVVDIAAQEDDEPEESGAGGKPKTDRESASRTLCRLCHSVQERGRIMTGLHLHVHLLHQVFEHFSDRNPVMAVDGFEQFVRECGAAESLRTSSAKLIFCDCALFQPDAGLHPPEFVAACVTLAAASAPANLRSASAKLDHFITRHMHGRLKLMSSEPMRRVMQNPAVNAVVSVLQKGLTAFFEGVANKKPALASDDDEDEVTLSEGAFLKLMRDLALVDERCTAKDLGLIFFNSQDAFDDSGMADMSFFEFLEALCAVGLTRVPNPYYTSAARLNIFFNERLLPNVKRKFPTVYTKMAAAMQVDLDSLTKEEAQPAANDDDGEMP